MITYKSTTIPIFDFKLRIYITDSWEELKGKLPIDEELYMGSNAVTINNHQGTNIVAVLRDREYGVVHESVHVKNNIWDYIGYKPQANNDEIDAYVVTYIYKKIIEVYDKHMNIVKS